MTERREWIETEAPGVYCAEPGCSKPRLEGSAWCGRHSEDNTPEVGRRDLERREERARVTSSALRQRALSAQNGHAG